jgi:transcriptional regulator with XRE-family HTH domain
MSAEEKIAGDFPDRLQSARDKRDISQQELARRAGLPASSISHFEGGGRKPSVDNLRRLANALDVSADFLLGRTEGMQAVSAATRIQADLDRLNAYDLKIAESFIKVLASKD